MVRRFGRRSSDKKLDCSEDPSAASKENDALKVNGIPEWENPMATASISSADLDLPKPPPARQPSIGASPNRRQTRRPSRRTSLSRSISLRDPKPPPPSDYLDDERGQRSFENMVIEVEGDECSCGDLTYDASVQYDEQYHRNQRSHEAQSHVTSPRKTTSIHGPRTRYSSHTNQSHHVIPNDHYRPEDDHQATDSFGSMSMSTSNTSGRISANSHRSSSPKARPNFVWKREGKKWAKVPIGDTGDPLDAIDESDERYQSSSRQASTRNLTEEERIGQLEQDLLHKAMEDSMRTFRRDSVKRLIVPEEELSFSSEEAEVDLERSLKNYRRNSGRSLVREAGLTSTRSLDIDPEAAAERLRQLEEEKALLELAMLQGGQKPQRGVTRAMSSDSNDRPPPRRSPRGTSDSFRSAVSNDYSSGSNQRSMDQSTQSFRSHGSSRSGMDNLGRSRHKQDLSQSGCHLTMIANRSHDRSDEGGRNINNSDDASKKGRWRRGSNGRFIRDSSPETPLQDANEAAMVEEALRRSMEEM